MLENIKKFWLQWRVTICSSLVCLVVGGLGGRLLTPVKVKTETVEKIVEKVVNIADKTVITKEIKHPDGTIETDVIKKDVTTNKSVVSDTEVKKNQTNQPAVAASDPYRPNWSVGAGVKVSPDNLLMPSYVFSLGHRMLGNLWGSFSYYTQDRAVSADAKVEF